MSPKAASATALRQLLWIVCGVVLLTTLVITVSWLFSGGSREPAAEQQAKMTTTETQTRPAFQPEAPVPGSQRGAPVAAPQAEAEQPPSPTLAEPESEPGQQAAGVPSRSEPPSAATGSEAVLQNSAPTETGGTTEAQAAAASPPDQASQHGYGVQLGAFGEAANARDLASRLKAQGYKAALEPKGKVTRVIVTGPKTRSEAEALRDALKKKGFPQATVVPLP